MGKINDADLDSIIINYTNIAKGLIRKEKLIPQKSKSRRQNKILGGAKVVLSNDKLLEIETTLINQAPLVYLLKLTTINKMVDTMIPFYEDDSNKSVRDEMELALEKIITNFEKDNNGEDIVYGYDLFDSRGENTNYKLYGIEKEIIVFNIFKLFYNLLDFPTEEERLQLGGFKKKFSGGKNINVFRINQEGIKEKILIDENKMQEGDERINDEEEAPFETAWNKWNKEGEELKEKPEEEPDEDAKIDYVPKQKIRHQTNKADYKITNKFKENITELLNQDTKDKKKTFLTDNIQYLAQDEKKIYYTKRNREQSKSSGGAPTKYKSTGQVVYIVYKNKKYKRTIYTKEKGKTRYCKMNNEYILLSKCKIIV